MAKGVDEKGSGSDRWAARPAGGWAGWLLARWNGRRRVEPRLALVERITLAPRQSLALIEAEGRRILVATSVEGGPAFYPLDEPASSRTRAGANAALHGRTRAARGVSW
jgi:hypothetical protein